MRQRLVNFYPVSILAGQVTDVAAMLPVLGVESAGFLELPYRLWVDVAPW